MTKIIYAITNDNEYCIIDNHKKQKKTCYEFIFKTKNYGEFQKYIKDKGLD